MDCSRKLENMERSPAETGRPSKIQTSSGNNFVTFLVHKLKLSLFLAFQGEKKKIQGSRYGTVA